MNPIESGFVFLNKPPGITSFSALSGVKREVRPRKVGHTGTLDKFARGLLIGVIGKATKFASYITELGKEYLTEFEFGKETDTLDPEGEVVRTSSSIPDLTKIQRCLERFSGPQSQVPPVYSAVHVKGERAYKLVREGKQPELKARRIEIYGIDILSYAAPILKILVRCSKGTYIRSLARDLGTACGSCASVVTLERTKIGNISLHEAVDPEQFSSSRDIVPVEQMIRRIENIGILHGRSDSIEAIYHGKPLVDGMFVEREQKDGYFAVLSEDERFLALLERKKGSFNYKFVGA